MEPPTNVKDSSKERPDTSKNTEEKSADAMELMLNSIVKERKLMFDLNTTFENFDMENKNEKEITETMECKTFSKYQEEIKKEYDEQIVEIQSYFNGKLDDQNLLQEEINNLREEKRNYEKKIKDMEKTNEQKYKDACTEQKRTQKECINLEAQIKILEKTHEAEKQVWTQRMSFIRTERSVGESNREEFDKKIKTIESMYEKHMEELKTELRSYDHKIKQYKKEAKKAESERNHLLDQISEQDREFIKLKTEQDELKKQIRKYESLLIQKMRTYSTAGTGNKIVTRTEVNSTATMSEETSTVDIQMTSGRGKDSDKPSEYDLKPKPLSITVDPTGNFLTIHSSSKNEIDISNLMIERTFPKGEKTQFKIPKGIKISAEKDLKILSKSASDKKAPGDIIATFQTWGTEKGDIKVKDTSGKDISSYQIG